MPTVIVSSDAASFGGNQFNHHHNDETLHAAVTSAMRRITDNSYVITAIDDNPAFGHKAITFWVVPKETK